MAQAPLLPYMVSKLHADSSYYYGLLMSTFSALQLLGSLMSGAQLTEQGNLDMPFHICNCAPDVRARLATADAYTVLLS